MATQITLAQCRSLVTAPGFSLRADAADAWDRAVTAFGATVLLAGAWRSYEAQEQFFRERYVRGNHAGKAGYTGDVRYWQGVPWTRRAGTAAAAVPGTSNHGSGLAVDVKTSRSTGDPPYPAAVVFVGFADPDRLRFLQVARPHGWADDEGRSVSEPWHLTYYPARDQHPTPATPPVILTADDMIELICVLYRHYLDRVQTDPDLLAWSDALSGKTPAQAHQAFRGALAESGTVRQAYRHLLDREPSPAEVETWSSQGLSIAQVWDGVGASAEAAT